MSGYRYGSYVLLLGDKELTRKNPKNLVTNI